MFDTTNMTAKEVKARVDQIHAALAPEKTYLANPVDPKTLLDASTEKSRMGQAIASGWFFDVARQTVELLRFTPQRLIQTSVKLNAAGPVFDNEYAALCALRNATVVDNKRRLAIVDARIKALLEAMTPSVEELTSAEPLLGKAHTTEQVAAPVVVEKQTAAEYVTALSESVAAEKASDELLAEAKKKAAAGKKAAAARKAAASKKAPIKKNTSKKAST